MAGKWLKATLLFAAASDIKSSEGLGVGGSVKIDTASCCFQLLSCEESLVLNFILNRVYMRASVCVCVREC